ncbi:MAG: GntR family transcriptional regulator [Canibacter sp.]
MTDANVEQLVTVSVVDAASNSLRERLFAGEFQAGEELKDTEIAARYGIARPTARAVVQQLVSEGLLERPPGHSARVRTFRPEEVTDIYRIRVLIELDAVREIKAKALPLDNIAEALEGFRTLHLANEDWTRIAEADVAFHSSVVATTGSPRLTASFASIATEIRLLIAVLKEQYSGGAPLFREHEELFELLQSGSPTEALAAWTEHLDSAESFLSQHLAS